MPFISVKTNQSINSATESNLKNKFAEAIKIIGKTEDWLMLEFQGERSMYFRGSNNEGIAFVEIKMFGKPCKLAFDEMTKEVTRIISVELDIPQSNIYVKYDPVDIWGYNGINF